jgi:hypothetical protein
MTYAGISHVNKTSLGLLKGRLFLDVTGDDQVKITNDKLKEKINSEYNSWMGWAIDKYHSREH